jgi:preprotein translocase subunit SecF
MHTEQQKIKTKVAVSSDGDRPASRLSGILTAVAVASALFLITTMSGCVDATQESNLEMRTRIAEEEAQQARQDALNAQIAAQRAQQAAQQQALQSQIRQAPEITESSVETRTIESRSGRPVIVIPPPPPTIKTGMAHDEAVTPLPPESIEWARHQSDLRQQDEERQRY